MAATKLSLKLLVDKNANRVLFAEAGKDFVDFLFYLLSLPVSAVIQLIIIASMVGSIGNLYQSVENLNETYMQPNQNKDLLLKPQVSNCVANVPLLLPESITHAEKQLYNCRNNHRCVTDCLNSYCAQCHSTMCYEVQFIGKDGSAANSTSEEGYVKGLVTYMVTDDLSISPLSMISAVALLNKFNVDFGALEERMVEFGIDEGLELLKASLQSKAALTTVFLTKQEVKVDAASDST